MGNDPLYESVENILQSYRQLTGASGGISVMEFLSVRQAAMEENRAGIWRESRKAEAPGRPALVPVPVSAPSSVPVKQIPAEKKEPPAAAESGFSLLKNLEDPWN